MILIFCKTCFVLVIDIQKKEDMIMNYRTVSYYDEFKCIGGACEDSCCDNWEIDLDDESLKFYMSQKGEFGKRLKKCTRVKDKQFILNGTRCPFHNDDDLCDIYIELGEEALCQTCTNFPRHIEEFDDLKEVSLTMSCPEASRIMLSKRDKMSFTCKEGSDREYGLKELKPVSRLAFWKRGHENKLDKPLYDELFKARVLIYEMLQDRSISVVLRALYVISFAEELQEKIDDNDYSAIADIITIYQNNREERVIVNDWDVKKSVDDPEYMGHKVQCAGPPQVVWMHIYLDIYEGLENIIAEWKNTLAAGKKHIESVYYWQNMNGFMNYYKDKEYEFEHILVYYIFSYFLGAAYDHDALTKVKFAVISYLIILELDVARWALNEKSFTYEDQVSIAHAYSKEVEHSYDNYESLQLVLSAHPDLTTDNFRKELEYILSIERAR